MKLREAFDRRAEGETEAIPITAGRCEKRVTAGGRGIFGPISTGFCGKPGRWLVGHEIRCGGHKVE